MRIASKSGSASTGIGGAYQRFGPAQSTGDARSLAGEEDIDSVLKIKTGNNLATANGTVTHPPFY